MDVTQVPFNRLVGLEPAPPDSEFLVALPAGLQFTNHIGTVHAAALVAVAEAASGAFLVRELGDRAAGFVPVVRRLEVKFKKPAVGRVSGRVTAPPDAASAWLAEATQRGRVLAAVPVEVVDDHGTVVLTASVEWFSARAA
jgi:acyl-coenzyme A thioesterase PaaI-like protein